MGFFDSIFGKKKEKEVRRNNESESIILNQEDINSLLNEIISDDNFITGDKSQDERIERLVKMGETAVYPIKETINYSFSSSRSRHEFENMGLLCEAIGKIGGESAFESLKYFANLNSNIFEYKFIRIGAIKGLSYLDDENVIEFFNKIKNNPDDAESRLITDLDPQINQIIKNTLNKNQSQLSQNPVEITGELDNSELSILLKDLNNSDALERAISAESLGKLGDIKAVDGLILTLNDNDEYVRLCTVQALGNIKDKRAFEPISQKLTDGDYAVRVCAADAMIKIDENEAVELFIETLAMQNEHWEVRKNAAHALGKVGDKRAVEPLIAALGDEYGDVRWTSAESLGKIGDKRAIKFLMPLLDDTAVAVPSRAAKAIVRLMNIDKSAELLINDLEHSSYGSDEMENARKDLSLLFQKEIEKMDIK